MTMLTEIVDLVIGSDTHKHSNSAAVINTTGALLEQATTPTNPDGYQALVDMADRHSGRRVWAIEGANSYGAGLARFLSDRGELVIELDRPKRPTRRNGAKSDEIDAVRAAREALSREHLAQPRAHGVRAALSVRLTARRSAIDAATIAQQQLHALIVAAPETLRGRLRDLTTPAMVQTCARLRINTHWDVTTRETAVVLRSLARRVLTLHTEAAEHEKTIRELVKAWRPDLLDTQGVGPIVAATVLCAWSHPQRFRSDAAFAMLAGTAPIPASSGITTRHRLNRSGDRQLNRAIHTLMLCRLRYDPTTRAYIERRRTQGLTDREIKRCLKRYITRQLYKQLENPPTPT
jgi:hypothetical protein